MVFTEDRCYSVMDVNLPGKACNVPALRDELSLLDVHVRASVFTALHLPRVKVLRKLTAGNISKLNVK